MITIQKKTKARNQTIKRRKDVTPQSFAIRSLFSAAVCFIASFGSMVGFPSYMNVACAVVSGHYCGAALLGALASYAIQGKLAQGAVQLCSILAAAMMNLFFPYYSKNNDPIRLSLFTASVTLTLSCASAAVAPNSFSVSMKIISSLMCACVVYAAAFVSERLHSGEPLRLHGLTAVYCAMLYIVIIATLSSCQLGIFNIGRILGCAAIPAAAKKKRAAGGAVMGALTAVSVTMCSSSLSANTMLLAAAGLIASAFCDFGRLAVALSFLISASAALATTGLNSDTFNMLTDIIIGTAIFTAVPSAWFSKLTSHFIILGSAADSAGQTASSRLLFASKTIDDIKDKLTMVSDTVENRSEKLTLTRRIINDACLCCKLYGECSENGNIKKLERICGCIGSNGDETLFNRLPEDCRRASEMPAIYRRCRDEQLADRAEAIRLREMRLFLREQLGSMTDILNDMSCRLSRKRDIDSQLSASAKKYFERKGCKGVRACVYTDENCCRRAEIYISGSFEYETAAVTTGLCRTLECDFELPGITSANNITKLEFDEIPPFSAEVGSYAALGSSVCSGDTLETVESSAGEHYILLSDGMGSGKRARLDSALSVSLARRMLFSGLSMTTAQRIINSVMRVKEWEESFATLDFLRLDLFSGRAEFLKSGAAPAYLYRDGGLIRIECSSYPAGILSSCAPDVCSYKLFDGDVLILASDGAPEDAVLRCSSIISESPDLSAEKIAFEIGSLCSQSAYAEGGDKNDDITVAAVKISRRKERMYI